MRLRSIRSKLLFAFVAVILLPLFTLGLLGPYISARTLESEATIHTWQLIRQVTRNIEFYVRQTERIISIVDANPDVQAFMAFEGSAQTFSAREQAAARQLLRAIADAHPEIAGILVVSEDNRPLSNEIQPITRDPLTEESWYREAADNPGTVQLLPRPIGRNLRNTEGEGGSHHRGVYDIFPHTPRRAEDVPEGALGSLNESCSLEGLRQVFVIPWAVRSTGCGDQKVISPESVLGVGTRAVGLWTEKPGRGVKVLIPLDRLAAIEDLTILLYGRLSFLSFAEKLTIRYNTLARSNLRPALLELRERLAGPPLPLPLEEEEVAELPIKWKRLLRSPYLRFRESAPVAFRFAVTPGKSRDDVQRGQLLVVNPHELVYMFDPLEASHNYGEDSFIVPRPRITRVRVREKYLEVASNGARLSLSMAPELREAAARWLS